MREEYYERLSKWFWIENKWMISMWCLMFIDMYKLCYVLIRWWKIENLVDIGEIVKVEQ